MNLAITAKGRNRIAYESWEETRGFVDSNDRWMNGRQAVRYAEKHDLIDPLYAGQHIDFLVSEYVKKQ
jgi:hypothetical protein